MDYIQECLEKFNNLPADLRDKMGSIETFDKIDALEKEYNVELTFLVILVCIGEVAVADMAEYLEERNGLAEEDAVEIKNQLLVKVFSQLWPPRAPIVEAEAPAEAQAEAPFVSQFATEEQMKSFFAEKLASLFRSRELQDDFNDNIFILLSANGLLQDELIKLFLASQEVLTSKPFIMDGKNQKGTIGNWINDFIRQNGSQLFDAIVLSSYLTASLNAKILDPDEKKLLDKLLKFYRNLAFFPESMGSRPIASWEIFPVDHTEGLNRTEDIFRPDLTMKPDVMPVAAITPSRAPLAAPAPKPIVKPAPAVVPAFNPAPVSIPTPVASPAPISAPAPAVVPAPIMAPVMTPPAAPLSTRDMEIKKLQDLLVKYPPASLEGRAIAAELKRLQGK